MTAINLLKAKIMHHRRPVREKSNKKAAPASGGKAAAGRPRASEGAPTNGSKTRQRILDVATQEFSTKGYDGARIDDIMRSYYFLKEQNVRIRFGPGRHPTSGAMFLYFEGPDEMIYEYSSGVRMITDESYMPRKFPARTSSFCAWGSKPDIPEFEAAARDANQ